MKSTSHQVRLHAQALESLPKATLKALCQEFGIKTNNTHNRNRQAMANALSQLSYKVTINIEWARPLAHES